MLTPSRADSEPHFHTAYAVVRSAVNPLELVTERAHVSEDRVGHFLDGILVLSLDHYLHGQRSLIVHLLDAYQGLREVVFVFLLEYGEELLGGVGG